MQLVVNCVYKEEVSEDTSNSSSLYSREYYQLLVVHLLLPI